MKPLSYYTGPRVYRALQPLKRFPLVMRAYYNSRYLTHACLDCLPYVFFQRLRRQELSSVRQTLSEHETTIPESSSAHEVMAFLSEQGIRFHQGRHTFYVPPQVNLSRVMGGFVDRYPADAGFKFLKNLCGEGAGGYLHGESGQDYPWARRVLMGSARDVFDGACLAEAFGLGPGVYDFAVLRNVGMQLTCYVVQHVSGRPPSIEEHACFMDTLRGLLRRGALALALPEGLECDDFAPADCSRNLIKADDGRCLYIDFQHFLMRDRRQTIDAILENEAEHLHFGQRHFLTRRKFLYQDIPGLSRGAKRDTMKRWAVMNRLLQAANITLKDRLVLDICCNSGMMLAGALSEGAFWGVGWDLPEAARTATRVQRVLGNSRLQFLGCRLSEDYQLANDIPVHLKPTIDGCVVLYLAASQHIGFMKALASIPWKALVYEGHQTDDHRTFAGDVDRMIRQWKCEVHGETQIKDGHCAGRPLAILVRRARD